MCVTTFVFRLLEYLKQSQRPTWKTHKNKLFFKKTNKIDHDSSVASETFARVLEVLEVCVFRNVANTKVMVHWHRLNLIYTSLNHWRSIEARFSRWCLPVFSFPGKYNFSSFSSSFGKWVEIFNSRLIAQCCIPNDFFMRQWKHYLFTCQTFV